MVFLASDFWPPPVAPVKRDVIGTHQIGHLPFGQVVIRLIDSGAPVMLGLTPRHVHTRRADEQDRSVPYGHPARQVPSRDLQEIADVSTRARVVISSKLHLGIFAMSYGALFLSYYG